MEIVGTPKPQPCSRLGATTSCNSNPGRSVGTATPHGVSSRQAGGWGPRKVVHWHWAREWQQRLDVSHGGTHHAQRGSRAMPSCTAATCITPALSCMSSVNCRAPPGGCQSWGRQDSSWSAMRAARAGNGSPAHGGIYRQYGQHRQRRQCRQTAARRQQLNRSRGTAYL
jgi:hypothetical protein